MLGKVQSSVNVSNVVGAKSRNKNVYRTFRQLEREKTNPNMILCELEDSSERQKGEEKYKLRGTDTAI